MEMAVNVLLKLIQGELTGKAVAIPELTAEQLWDIYRLAKSHEVTPLAASGLRRAGKFPDGELGTAFKKELLTAVYSDETKVNELEQLCELLGAAEIAHLPLKGAVIRNLYPEAWMRTRCDVDLLICPKDLERACACIKASGRKVGGETRHDVPVKGPNGVHTELHYVMHGDNELVQPKLLERVWEYARPVQPGSFTYELSDDMFYFSFMAHTAKHARNGGCGLRSVVDIWLLEHVQPHDRRKRDALIAEGGLQVFDSLIRQLAEAWFTAGSYEGCSEAVRNLGDYILRSGVYGNLENWAASWDVSPRGFFLSRLINPLPQMKQKYPILEKRPWLFPLYQVVRWFDILFDPAHIRTVVDRQKTVKSVDKAQRQQMEQLMQQIGLLERS